MWQLAETRRRARRGVPRLRRPGRRRERLALQRERGARHRPDPRARRARRRRRARRAPRRGSRSPRRRHDPASSAERHAPGSLPHPLGGSAWAARRGRRGGTPAGPRRRRAPARVRPRRRPRRAVAARPRRRRLGGARRVGRRARRGARRAVPRERRGRVDLRGATRTASCSASCRRGSSSRRAIPTPSRFAAHAAGVPVGVLGAAERRPPASSKGSSTWRSTSCARPRRSWADVAHQGPPTAADGVAPRCASTVVVGRGRTVARRTLAARVSRARGLELVEQLVGHREAAGADAERDVGLVRAVVVRAARRHEAVAAARARRAARSRARRVASSGTRRP